GGSRVTVQAPVAPTSAYSASERNICPPFLRGKRRAAQGKVPANQGSPPPPAGAVRRRKSVVPNTAMRRAKIVCTLGPATSTPERIGQLIDAGMDVARLNFSHGDRDTHLRTFQTVRAEAERRDRAVAVLLDVQGPKIRVGRFAEGQVELVAGQEFVITTDTSVPGDARRVSTTYAGLPGDVKVGAQILLDDGLLALEVAEVREREVVTVVRTGGVLKNNKGINLPDAEVSAPALTEKDRADLGFAVRIGVDYIALSFVRSAADVRQARTLVTANGQSIPIIAKIEKPQAVERLEEIITEAYGIMVARC